MVADGGILKVLHGDRIILEEKKRMRRYYYLTESPVQDGASKIRRSLERDGAPSEGGSDTRREIREDERRYRRVRFLLLQKDTLSKSQFRKSMAYNGDGIEKPSSTSIFVHP